MSDYIQFFGVTGDKELIFSNKLRAGGLHLSLYGQKIVMDPGPGTLQAFVEQYPGQIENLDAVILSHIHFDHSNEINIFIEGMTNEGHKSDCAVFVPEQAILEQALLPYVRVYIQNLHIVRELSSYTLGTLTVQTAISHKHGVENYGYSFLQNEKNIVSVLTDTVYFNGLADSYPKGGILVVNVPYYSAPPNQKMKHLTALDIPKLAERIQPEKIILTHFGRNIFKYGINRCIEELKTKTGIDVVAAIPNQRFSLF